jgi:hypothetical protein
MRFYIGAAFLLAGCGEERPATESPQLQPRAAISARAESNSTLQPGQYHPRRPVVTISIAYPPAVAHVSRIMAFEACCLPAPSSQFSSTFTFSST